MPDYRLDLLIAGRLKQELVTLEGLARHQPGVATRTRLISNGHTNPLHDVDPLPDALLLSVSETWREELGALADSPPPERPPMLVVGPAGDTDLLRMAMRAGARDFFTHPVDPEELGAALERIGRDVAAQRDQGRATLTVVVNGKGGAGASVIAGNLAHMLAVPGGSRVALVDMDLQFGSLPLYFDLTPKEGLLQAIDLIESLDTVALEGLMQKHASGLRILGTSHERLVIPGEVPEARIRMLMDLLSRSYDHVVVDLPRQIDALFAATVERASRIAIVMQQSVTHLRDTRTLLGVLRQELTVPADNMTVIVNRWDKTGAVTHKDIERAIGDVELVLIPNDHQRVSQSVNLGIPLYEGHRNAPVTQALMRFAERTGGRPLSRRGLLNRFLHRGGEKWT
jgi:pilus assembly protein CpaE